MRRPTNLLVRFLFPLVALLASLAPHLVAAESVEAKEQLAKILQDHAAWTRSRGALGHRADLRRADLHGAQLNGVDSTDADLREAVWAVPN
jgi:uncharacterized protein YjbI with pentapeptide repeats